MQTGDPRGYEDISSDTALGDAGLSPVQVGNFSIRFQSL